MARAPRSRPLYRTHAIAIATALAALVTGATAAAQTASQPDRSAQTATVTCTSTAGELQTCAANTKSGVTLVRTLGGLACVLGQTWGFDQNGVWVTGGCSGEFAVAPAAGAATQTSSGFFGRYTPGDGFTVADAEHGALTFRAFTYLRYLNQLEVEPTYTDAFGRTRNIQQRQDIQFQKLILAFDGWLVDERFRYHAFVWTQNTNFATTTSTVVGGTLSFRFNEYLTVGAGLTPLPGVRSTEGNFPHWLAVDARLIADEFMRPSYTTGVFVNGAITDGLEYRAMLGNNISQFGIDAGQLDNNLDTLSLGLAWMPTTGEFGRQGEIGDFEMHESLATRIAAHYTRSDEDRVSQPTTDAFENVQLRVSDGSIIFQLGLFAPGTQIDRARYQLFSLDGGLKYRGISADIGYYRRRLDRFEVRPRPLPFAALHDDALMVEGSAMALPNQLQFYIGGSKVFGEYGNPRDFRIGANYYPLGNQVLRWNFEYLDLSRSPVGALNLPYSVGMDGPVFHSSLMLWF